VCSNVRCSVCVCVAVYVVVCVALCVAVCVAVCVVECVHFLLLMSLGVAVQEEMVVWV